MENDKFIMIEEDKKQDKASLIEEKSGTNLTNNEKLELLVKMIQDVEKKIENDDSIKKLIK